MKDTLSQSCSSLETKQLGCKFTEVHAGTERNDAPSDHCKINTHKLDRDGRNQLTFQAPVEANQYGLIATPFEGTI